MAAAQPRIIKREFVNPKKQFANRVLPACFYQLSPEAIFAIVGIIILPFLIPVANIICGVISCLFQAWFLMIGSGLINVIWTIMSFVKVFGMVCLVVTLVLAAMYVYYTYGCDDSKRSGVVPGFGDFCLSIAYTIGFPVSGSVLNFLSTDGQ